MVMDNYRLNFFKPVCIIGSELINVSIEFDDDISELLPYINAEMGPGIFDPERKFLRINQGQRAIVFTPHKVSISKCADDQEAKKLAAELREKIADIAARKDQIKPSFETIGKVTALDIYKHLPRTNCGQCGYKTCLAFANAVTQGEADVEDCPPLHQPEHADKLKALKELFAPKPAS